jgi:predicted nucleic acid-binding protein
MCIVIDINTFASVFDSTSGKHADFKPVLDWIMLGKGKIVYGGSKYREELGKAKKYLNFLGELAKVRKIVVVDDVKVDDTQAELEKRVNHQKFNDPHLVAIIIVSGCKLICSNDKEAYPFFKNKDLYRNQGSRPPKIYAKANNSNLLSDENIAAICKPLGRLPNRVSQQLLGFARRNFE